jgi:hypothetical protein
MMLRAAALQMHHHHRNHQSCRPWVLLLLAPIQQSQGVS